MLGGGIGFVGLALAAQTNDPTIAIIGFGIVGLGFSCIAPILFSASAQTPGVHPSSGIAAIATAFILGFLVARPLVGELAEYYGLAAGIWLAAALTLFAAVFSLFVRFGKD